MAQLDDRRPSLHLVEGVRRLWAIAALQRVDDIHEGFKTSVESRSDDGAAGNICPRVTYTINVGLRKVGDAAPPWGTEPPTRNLIGVGGRSWFLLEALPLLSLYYFLALLLFLLG